MNNTHSWHHHSRWPEMHPYAYRKYRQRRRRALWAALLEAMRLAVLARWEELELAQ